MRQEFLRSVDHTPEVDGEGALEGGDVGVFDRAAGGADAGVVVELMHHTVGSNDGDGPGSDGGAVGDVDAGHMDSTTERADEGGGVFDGDGVDVGEGEPGATASEFQREGPTDARTRPRDRDDFAFHAADFRCVHGGSIVDVPLARGLETRQALRMTTTAADRHSLDDLIARCAAGERPTFVHFWGHTPAVAGVVDKSCLSQWYPAPFVVDGVRFATAEHWMMHGKARVFHDDKTAARVLVDDDPAIAKRLGREVDGFETPVWEQHRFALVVAGSLHKLRAHPTLRAFVESTGDAVLVEASPHDAVWGIGMTAADDGANDPARWRGLNLLGFALMQARAQLRT